MNPEYIRLIVAFVLGSFFGSWLGWQIAGAL